MRKSRVPLSSADLHYICAVDQRPKMFQLPTGSFTVILGANQHRLGEQPACGARAYGRGGLAGQVVVVGVQVLSQSFYSLTIPASNLKA